MPTNSNGSVSAVKYKRYNAYGDMTENWFFYKKNLQGDVIGLLDVNGNQVVTYTYDSWGKLLSTTDTSGCGMGSRNEYLYRGYRYDRDLGLYYLQSRYYDPETGRWISPEPNVYNGQFDEGAGLIGSNVYAYCANNPIVFKDDTGESISLAVCVDWRGCWCYCWRSCVKDDLR